MTAMSADAVRALRPKLVLGSTLVTLIAGCGSSPDTSRDDATTSTKAPPGPPGRLVYMDAIGDRSQLFVVGADGRGLRQLTRLAGEQLEPDWSPDGARIVFERDFARRAGVYLMDADGTDVRQLSPGRSADRYAGQPAFSSDGRWVVFGRQTGTRTNGIAYMPVSGGRVRTVTNNTEFAQLGGGRCVCDDDPSFTPDARHISPQNSSER